MLLVTAFLLTAIGVGMWFLLGQHEIIPPKEITARAGQDLRVPLADLRSDKARLYRIEDERGETIGVFMKARGRERIVVTFAACRRCERSARPSRLSNGELICGHCGEPMPLLEEGATLPTVKDCTPVPVPFRIEGGSVVVGAADIASGRPLFARRAD
jgi:uncharacterized membrane protein